jgi:Tripartite tricarboxylate transporter family receptor
MINRKPIDLDCRDCSHFAAWGIGINNSGQIVGNYGHTWDVPRVASAGTGSTTHACGELFKMMASVDLFHVPYRGAQVFPALLAGSTGERIVVVTAKARRLPALT